ncbi:AAA family ATPase [Hyalangium rubrum]|uniref:ATP-binding protein n=1 Tax=Hyalangium rubrum TaxID=3103134 RepID=A0ABU5H3T7_9BACT|nr:AAA family ATPase [Hyalangium sp. s54d21]MDY7228128.1 ATP-binding protein [Hyalangium sp. s54d21]
MKLTKLQIHKYRGVAPGTELLFSPSLNLVLGNNGTGRTTLLELLSIVLCSDFSGLGQEEFSLEYDLELPGMDIHVTARNERRTGPVQLEGGLGDNAALSRLRAKEAPPVFEPLIEAALRLEAPDSQVVVRANASGLFCEVDGQSAYARRMQWSVLDRSVWTLIFMVAQFIAPEVKDRLKELLRRTFLLGPSRFDEALGMFEHIGTIRYAMEMRAGEVFPLGLMALPTWMPGWLRARVERESPGTVIEFPHHELEGNFLGRFVSLAGFASGKLRVEVLEKRTFEDGGRLGFGQFGFQFTRKDGTELTQAQLGHGQKRLLSFLYYLDVNEDFAVADELANGLQPRWVEACLREIGGRQAFLTSQNPLLFEYISFASTGDIRASLIHCDIGLRAGREWLVWTHPTGESAERLYEAIRARQRPLGELLRAHGLW